MQVPGGVVDEVSPWMFTVPILPLAVLVAVGEFHQSPRANQRAAFFDWDWSSAEREFKRAIELNPNSALSHRLYAIYLDTTGQVNESNAEAQRAQELDPLSPKIVSGLGWVYLSTRRYDESIAQFQKALDLYPNAAVIRASLAWAYAMKRMYPQALAEYDNIADQDKAVAAEN